MYGLIVLSILLVASPLYSQSAEALLQRSYHEDDVKAVHTLVRALEIEPENPAIAFRIGFLLHKMNRWSEAIKYYELTLKNSPCHERAINNLAGISFSSNDIDRAEELYKKSIQCNDSFYLPHYNLGNILQAKGKRVEAILQYRRSLELNPDHDKSRLNLAIGLANEARFMDTEDEKRTVILSEAGEHAKIVVEKNPNDPMALLQYAVILADLHNFKEAFRYLDRAARFSYGKTSMELRIKEQRERIERNEKIFLENEKKKRDPFGGLFD